MKSTPLLNSPFSPLTSESGSAGVTVLILIVVGLFAIYFSGFLSFREYDPNNQSGAKYIIVEEPPTEGKSGLNITKLKLEEYVSPTPTPAPTIIIPTRAVTPPPPAPTKSITPTKGPTKTPTPTEPPPPPPERIPQ